MLQKFPPFRQLQLRLHRVYHYVFVNGGKIPTNRKWD